MHANVVLLGVVAVAILGATAGVAAGQDDLPARIAEGGLSLAAAGGNSAIGGFGAVEAGAEAYAVWFGADAYGDGVSVSAAGVYRAPLREGVRAHVLVGVVRAHQGGVGPFGGGGVLFGGDTGIRVTASVARTQGSMGVKLQAGGYLGF